MVQDKLTIQTFLCFLKHKSIEGLSLFHDHIALTHKTMKSIKKLLSVCVEDTLDWSVQNPDLNPIKHLWDEVGCQPGARTVHPTSVPDLADTLVAEREKIPAARFANLAGSLP